jgi:hypothetical protein
MKQVRWKEIYHLNWKEITRETLRWIKSSWCKYPHTPFGGHPVNAPGGRPSNSPDLCVIEYVFNVWSDNVYKQNPKTVEQLKIIAEQEWEKIPQSLIQKTFKHMTKVYPHVVAQRGELYSK